MTKALFDSKISMQNNFCKVSEFLIPACQPTVHRYWTTWNVFLRQRKSSFATFCIVLLHFYLSHLLRLGLCCNWQLWLSYRTRDKRTPEKKLDFRSTDSNFESFCKKTFSCCSDNFSSQSVLVKSHPRGLFLVTSLRDGGKTSTKIFIKWLFRLKVY